MVEVEVASLKHAHHLHALGGFAVEGDRGGLYDLHDEPLQRGGVDCENTLVGEAAHAVEQGVHAEERLGGEGRVLRGEG